MHRHVVLGQSTLGQYKVSSDGQRGGRQPSESRFLTAAAMLMGELLTAIQNDLPVKIVVFNNSALAFVEIEMMSAGIPPFGTDLKNPNFSKVADACGLLGVRVSTPEQLRPALDKAFAHKGPALVEVLTERRELSMPPTITPDQALGFSLYLTKCVMNGRGDEIIDLAKANLMNRLFGD